MTSPVSRSRWRKIGYRVLGAVVIAGATSGVVFGYLQGRDERAIEAERESAVKPPLRVSTVDGEPTITLDEPALKNGGIQIVQLQTAAGVAQIEAYGTVLDLQPLTDLSNNYATAAIQLQTAQARRDASRTAFERAQRLYQDQQNISAAQLQSSDAAFRVDEIAVAAAQTQLQNLAASAAQQWGSVLAMALVDRTPLITRLLQREDVLVQVTLVPGQAMAEPPKTAIARADSISGQMQFVSPAPRTDARIQGQSFFYLAPANHGLLPGMNIAVTLPTGRSTGGVIVPSSAVVWSEGRAWAYFRTGPRTFTRRAIATARPEPDGGYIVTATPGAEVVGPGAQMLLSEEFRAQINVGED